MKRFPNSGRQHTCMLMEHRLESKPVLLTTIVADVEHP